MVYLSHIEAYRDQAFLNGKLLRWQPETIAMLPMGVGVLPFLVPGSDSLMEATVTGLREHDIVLWSKHGVMSRSYISVDHATDIIEYAEAAARYECMDLASGSRAEGLTAEELSAIAGAFGVSSKILS
jgi:rhamnulose-1-phosphate aldolase